MYLYATRCRLFHRYNRPRMRQQSIVLVAAAFVVVSCSRPSKTAADLVVVNGNVWTGDQSQADARAVAIAGDRIVAVGSAGDIDAWRGPGTRVVDAGRCRVVPGFNDAHVHFVDGGRQLDNVDLKDADSPEEFARRKGRMDSRRRLGRPALDAAQTADAAARRPVDADHSGLREPLRRSHGSRQHGSADSGRCDGEDERSAGRNDRARRCGKSDRRPQGRGDEFRGAGNPSHDARAADPRRQARP